MALKIGELLVKEGVITRKQLEDALKRQIIFGGRLGTNLIEMELVSEEGLVHYLSKQMDVPFVPPEQLLNIPPEIINLISKEIAEEYKLIPLGLEKKRLTAAMWDPSDLSAVDAVSFITGYIIRPLVCSEYRLLLALEQYYGIEREVRYIQMSQETTDNLGPDGDADRKSAPEVEAIELNDFSPFKDVLDETELMDASPYLSEEPAWGELPDQPPAVVPTAPSPQLPPPAPPQPSRAPEPPVFKPSAPAVAQPRLSPPPEPVPPASAPLSPAPASDAVTPPLDLLLASLAEAKDRDAIADAVIDYVGREYQRVALFMIKGKIAAGWKGAVRNTAIAGFDNFQLPLDEPSLLKIVADTQNFYLGPVLDTPGNGRILAALGGKPPETALLIPLIMMGRVVTIFYVDGGKELGNNLFDLKKLLGKAALAFEILILKNKILMG